MEVSDSLLREPACVQSLLSEEPGPLLFRAVARWALGASVVVLAAALPAQGAPPAARAASGWSYEIANRVPAPRAVLVLMPGFGGAFSEFSEAGGTAAHRSVLADSLAARGIALVLVAPPAGVLFGDDTHLQQLEATVRETVGKLSADALPLAIGGFSAGGTDAVLFAERCAAGRCTMPHAVRAVFAVDAPLDWFRLWENASMVVEHRPPGANVEEAQRILAALEARLGAQPSPAASRYLESSPLAAKARGGGNARSLAGVAVRAYTEPDIQWWMEQRGLDYYGMNASDAASLIRHLKLLGNTRAELVVTTGRGYRANGLRHPHSWSIVEQGELARWLGTQLLSR